MPRQSTPVIVWHAGEPLTVPIDWYRNAHRILGRYAPTATQFAIQSNGIGVTPAWIDFLIETGTSLNLSIDGPQRFHDARRQTRRGGPTWQIVRNSLALLQEADIFPNVICVLSPESLQRATEYLAFFIDHNITIVSFSIDEIEGKNTSSSFAGANHKLAMTEFLIELMRGALAASFPLRIRELERIASIRAGSNKLANEQVRPWDIVIVDARGNLSTFSPEATEVESEQYGNFVFGNILTGSLAQAVESQYVRQLSADIDAGIKACRQSCQYFSVCGGGAPINKLTENGSARSTETLYCRLTTQAAADALMILADQSYPW